MRVQSFPKNNRKLGSLAAAPIGYSAHDGFSPALVDGPGLRPFPTPRGETARMAGADGLDHRYQTVQSENGTGSPVKLAVESQFASTRQLQKTSSAAAGTHALSL
jgi:hypothetical protein